MYSAGTKASTAFTQHIPKTICRYDTLRKPFRIKWLHCSNKWNDRFCAKSNSSIFRNKMESESYEKFLTSKAKLCNRPADREKYCSLLYKRAALLRTPVRGLEDVKILALCNYMFLKKLKRYFFVQRNGVPFSEKLQSYDHENNLTSEACLRSRYGNSWHTHRMMYNRFAKLHTSVWGLQK